MSSINGVELSDNRYTVKQKAVRNAYRVYDSAGKEVLRTKQNLMKMKEEFPFTDPDGNEVFTVKAENLMDIAGDYVLKDAETGEEFAVLSKEFTLLIHRWKIKNSNGEKIARIESRGKAVGLLRSLSELFQLLPHRYTIEDSEGKHVGTIKGKFRIRDHYEIELEEEVDRKEAVLAAAITIDALEGN
ncbi:MAG: LURP-one-related/scramblase family protein [Candidatus Nanohalobium sp.]